MPEGSCCSIEAAVSAGRTHGQLESMSETAA
jgi:hypothetical protein